MARVLETADRRDGLRRRAALARRRRAHSPPASSRGRAALWLPRPGRGRSAPSARRPPACAAGRSPTPWPTPGLAARRARTPSDYRAAMRPAGITREREAQLLARARSGGLAARFPSARRSRTPVRAARGRPAALRRERLDARARRAGPRPVGRAAPGPLAAVGLGIGTWAIIVERLRARPVVPLRQRAGSARSANAVVVGAGDERRARAFDQPDALGARVAPARRRRRAQRHRHRGCTSAPAWGPARATA